MEIVKFKNLINNYKVVALDTSIFIYHLEDHPKFGSLAEIIFELAEKNRLKIISSIISPIEILTGYEKAKDFNARSNFIQMMNLFPNIEIYNLASNLVDQIVNLRVKYNLKTPDAIELATAIENKAEVFITNDKKLKKIKEIKIICFS